MIDIKNIYKYFNKQKVLNGVNCTINKGEKVVIIGASGSGKSTLLRCMNLLTEPTYGEVWMEGKLLTPVDPYLHYDVIKLSKTYKKLCEEKEEQGIIYSEEDIIKEIKKNDLLNENYKNQIVLIDDQRIIIGMSLLANGFDMNSVDDQELEIAKDWLLKLKPNIKAYDSDSPKNFLISKEANIAVLWNAEGALASREITTIENVFPKEGVALSVDNFVIPKGVKNKEEARFFRAFSNIII